jgi:quercetin dioxygenase-like cupin family protein
MATPLPPVRRIITGLNSNGRSRFEDDGPAHIVENPNRVGLFAQDVWGTGPLPVPIDDPDRSGEATGIMPPAGGSILHIIDYPPEPKDEDERERLYQSMRARFRQAGTNPEPGQRRFPDGPHPGMHVTDSIDYAIVMSGEIYAIMDEGQTLMKAGDILIQRGTSHAWSNRSDDYCRVAFVLVEATPSVS